MKKPFFQTEAQRQHAITAQHRLVWLMEYTNLTEYEITLIAEILRPVYTQGIGIDSINYEGEEIANNYYELSLDGDLLPVIKIRPMRESKHAPLQHFDRELYNPRFNLGNA